MAPVETDVVAVDKKTGLGVAAAPPTPALGPPPGNLAPSPPRGLCPGVLLRPGKSCWVPYRGGFLYEFELRRVVCNFELISTSYEDSTLIISFVLRTSKG